MQWVCQISEGVTSLFSVGGFRQSPGLSKLSTTIERFVVDACGGNPRISGVDGQGAMKEASPGLIDNLESSVSLDSVVWGTGEIEQSKYLQRTMFRSSALRGALRVSMRSCRTAVKASMAGWIKGLPRLGCRSGSIKTPGS